MNAIEIKNISKSFKDFKLDNISFNLPSGCILGLIGENGAGKSTTIRLILNGLDLDEGSIKVLNKDNSLIDMNDVGVVSDVFGLPECLNLLEIENVLKNIYSNWNHDVYQDLCKKLDISLDKKYKDMSTGNKMKTRIIAAMSHNPSLLILDEPTNGLDPVVRDEVVNLLFEYTRDENHSILISSHIVSDLEKLCDYIAFMHKGKLLLCEEKDELLNQYGLIKCLNNEEIELDEKAIIKKKVSSYNTEILVDKRYLNSDIHTNNISLEDLFVYLVKE